MGYLRVNITNIVSPNPFKVSFKSVVGDDSAYGMFTGYTYYHNGTDYSTYAACPSYPAGTTSIEISSNELDFNSNCWVKIEDTVTKTMLSDGTEIPRYIIENIYLHDPIAYQSCCPQPVALTAVCYHDCFPPFSLTAVCATDATPTPTPTAVVQTPTPTAVVQTPTPTPTEVSSCSAPTLNSVTLNSGSLFTLNYGTPTNCTALTLSRSRDQVTWTNSTGGCTTGRQMDTLDATGTWYFRLTQICSGGQGDSNIVSYTYESVPTPTPTPTAVVQGPTPTPTAVVQGPTPTPTTISYYYYAMGDCNDMRYAGTETTIFGFGAPLVVPVCMTSAQITQWYSTANFAQQTLNIDYDDPCAFGEGYSGVTVGRSTTQLTEGTVYLVSGQCLSVISINAEYVGEWGVDLDGKTPITGDNPCGACDPPFTGYTLTGYSGVTCDTGENILAVTIFGSLVVGNVYGIQLYNGNTPAGDARCMTINANLGPQLTITDPETNPYSGYHISDAGPVVLGQMFQGYGDCPTCLSVPKKYKIDGVRCDNSSFSVTVWSDTLPSIGINDTFRVNDSFLSTYCWKVTAKDNYKSVVYSTPEWGILDTGCTPCDGSPPPTPTPTPVDGGDTGGGSGS
jgi:hypothetical protein